MYELNVAGMSCNRCITMITESIREIDADATVGVDLHKQKVRVDSDADLDDITSAINGAGYPVIDPAGDQDL